jgi:capsular exopolysaccharide synthesis family protein
MTVVVVGTFMATPEYVASTMLRVVPPPLGSIDFLSYSPDRDARLINTYVEIATSGPVLEELTQRLRLDNPPQIEVEALADTELIQISVENRNPILAREAANTLAEILVAQSEELYAGDRETPRHILGEQLAQTEEELNRALEELESQIAQSPEDSERIAAARRSVELKQETYATLLRLYEQAQAREALFENTLYVVEPAVTPQAPARPRKGLNITLGFVVGLVGAMGLALLFEGLDTTLHTVEQIEGVTELPTLGEIPAAVGWQQETPLNGTSSSEEAFRRLRTNIFALGQDAPVQTLLVTSAGPGEGKSTIVAKLASAMAQSGRKVIAVDGDLRRPALHEILDLPNERGLSSILHQEATLDEAVQESTTTGIQVLTSGPLPPNPAELLGSPEMTTLLQRLTQEFDLVLLDTPALLPVIDAAVLAPIADGVVLVVELAQARQEAVRTACRQLASVKARPVGVVVNRAGQSHRHYYHSPDVP